MSPDEIIQLSQLSRLSGISYEVQKILYKNMFGSNRLCQVGEVAAELGMSARSLQRKLTAEGVWYEQIQNEIKRYKCVYYMVAQPKLDIVKLAEIVGFKDRSTFSYAVIQWFECSPPTLKRVLKGVTLKRGIQRELAHVDMRLLDNTRNDLKALHAQLKKNGVSKEALTESNEIQKQLTQLNKRLQKFRM